jgi:hypothetical protein
LGVWVFFFFTGMPFFQSSSLAISADP